MLDTPRLTLRPFKISDYKAVYEFGSNKEVQKYTGGKLIESITESVMETAEMFFGESTHVYKPKRK